MQHKLKAPPYHFVQKFGRGKRVFVTKDALSHAKIGGVKRYQARKVPEGIEIRIQK